MDLLPVACIASIDGSPNSSSGMIMQSYELSAPWQSDESSFLECYWRTEMTISKCDAKTPLSHSRKHRWISAHHLQFLSCRKKAMHLVYQQIEQTKKLRGL